MLVSPLAAAGLMLKKVAALLLVATALRAQPVVIPSSNVALKTALATMRADNAWTIDQQVSICEIPSPPFKEAMRATEFKKRLGK